MATKTSKAQTCGIDINGCAKDINAELKTAWEEGYDYIVSEFCDISERLKKPSLDFHNVERKKQFCGNTSLEVHLDIPTWSNQNVFKMTHGLELLDSTDPDVRNRAEADFVSQMQYASYCQTPGVLVKVPIPAVVDKPKFPSNFVRYIVQACNSSNGFYVLELGLTDDVNNQEDEAKASDRLQAISGFKPNIPKRNFKPEHAWKTQLMEKGLTVNKLSKSSVYEKLEKLKNFKHPEDLHEIPVLPEKEFNMWKLWNRVRYMSDQHAKLAIAIRLTARVPSDDIIEKWLGEPVKFLIIPTTLFQLNKGGFPILPKAHQKIVKKFMNLDRIEIVIRLTDNDSYDESDYHGATVYRQFINHLKEQVVDEDKNRAIKPYSDFDGYQDYLQHPLQPLHDHLDSNTYEVFERDPVKYQLYEMAMTDAIRDTNTGKKSRYEIIVAGAGRGPLVQRAIHACNLNGLEDVRIVIIEKNPSAILTLRQRYSQDWKPRPPLETVVPYSPDQDPNLVPERLQKLQKVRVIPEIVLLEADMREAVPKLLEIMPERADLLVSELLGSFGDNELSPECLDPAQLMLKPETGVSIPQNYTAYLAPVTTQKLYNELRRQGHHQKVKDTQYETGYVVHMSNYAKLAEAKAVWTFEHPSKTVQDEAVEIYNKNGKLVDIQLPHSSRNERFETISWKNRLSGGVSLHGFTGYFESVLYKNHLMSTNPDTHTIGMFSWFPIYFPLRPHDIVQQVQPGQEIEVTMWRKAHKAYVWYEYALQEPRMSRIYNSDGWVHKIGC